jgi:hypothetical protein
MQATSAVTRELTEMHEQTQSIHQQSDQYVDESELPFTTAPASPAGDSDALAAEPSGDGPRVAPHVRATPEPREDLGPAAG